MKTLFLITEVMDNNYDAISVFDDEDGALCRFNVIKRIDGYKQGKHWSYRLSKVYIDEDWDGDHTSLSDHIVREHEIDSFIMYDEGTLDRTGGRGDMALLHGYECRWCAAREELEYVFFFQGEREEGTVMQSDLHKWYFR